jgi:hypothetical protein
MSWRNEIYARQKKQPTDSEWKSNDEFVRNGFAQFECAALKQRLQAA